MPPPGERLALALRARARLHRRAAARLAHFSRAARAARADAQRALRALRALRESSEKERKTGVCAKTSCLNFEFQASFCITNLNDSS